MWPVGFIALGCQRAVYWGPKVLARSEKAKQWGGIYHIKCSCF